MSRNTNNVKKPYCKVCYDAGKSEREYTNHWVKDLNGKTTCPTLLNTECRYCHKFGHTSKFCDVLAIRKRDTRWEHPRSEVVHKEQPQTNYRRPQNSFAVLCDNDVSNEEVSNIIIDHSEPLGNSWASIASKPKKMTPVTKPGVVTLTGCGVKASEPTAKTQVAETEAPPFVQKKYIPTSKRNWADWSESEDEYEDEIEDELYYSDDNNDRW